MNKDQFRRSLLAVAAILASLPAGYGMAQQAKTPAAGSAAAAGDIADFFQQVGDRIYEEDCIFELSQEQLEIQQALIEAYVKQGASSPLARQLAVKQIQPAKLSAECERIKNLSKAAPPAPPAATPPPSMVRTPPLETALPRF